MEFHWRVASPQDIEEQIEMAAGRMIPLPPPAPATGPLTVLPENPRYFTDGSGEAVYLTGSHTWANFQDQGPRNPPRVFDFDQYLDFLQAHGHNFIRLWSSEGARTTSRGDGWSLDPRSPFDRTGPGTALDGGPKWDLTRFDQAYFDRLRSRVEAAGRRGMYVSVMLFNGFSVSHAKGDPRFRSAWSDHPFNAANNINGIDGDPNRDGKGEETHELRDPRALAVQEAYVRKVIDTVNDLDNVLYEISNESHASSTDWQYHMIGLIKDYESGKPKQHPVGMTVEYPGGQNDELFSSDADWISPKGTAGMWPGDWTTDLPAPADGRKVILADSDHIWGIGGDRDWVWRSFTRGQNVLFMDGYDGDGIAVRGQMFQLDDPKWVGLRLNMGYARSFAERMDLTRARPDTTACSTRYCMASVSGSKPEFLVYAPEGGEAWVDLSDVPTAVDVEWLDPKTGEVVVTEPRQGGSVEYFSPPFEGDYVLYLY